MSPPWLLTAPAACWIVIPGFRRTSPNAGELFGPPGTLPANVAVTLTAPETSVPETVTPLTPLSATVIVGSAPAAAAVPANPSAPALGEGAGCGDERHERYQSLCHLLGPLLSSLIELFGDHRARQAVAKWPEAVPSGQPPLPPPPRGGRWGQGDSSGCA